MPQAGMLALMALAIAVVGHPVPSTECTLQWCPTWYRSSLIATPSLEEEVPEQLALAHKNEDRLEATRGRGLTDRAAGS